MKHTILSSETLYKGRAFNVLKVELQLPDKRTTHYDLVQHHDAVTILPVDDDGQIWFVEQYRLGALKSLLELPAGVLAPGEDHALGAMRELQEEIGKSASHLNRLGGFYMAPGYSSEFMHVYLATGLSDDPLPQDSDEFLKIKKISVERAYKMAAAGELEDGKSLTALFMAQPILLP